MMYHNYNLYVVFSQPIKSDYRSNKQRIEEDGKTVGKFLVFHFEAFLGQTFDGHQWRHLSIPTTCLFLSDHVLLYSTRAFMELDNRRSMGKL